jgi:hypothetical protein
MVWLDRGALPWGQPLPGSMGAYPHVVVIAGPVDGDSVTVHDVASLPFQVPPSELARARAQVGKERHRLLAVRGPAEVDLAAACHEAIASCAQELAGRAHFKQFAANFGVRALEKWASLVENGKDKKGWPRLFSGGVALWNALTWGHYWIESAGTGGGAFRPLYAAFLDEAKALTGRRGLGDVAGAYRALGASWTALAHAMLGAAPLLVETRTALADQRRAIAGGDRGVGALAAIHGRLEALRQRAASGEIDAEAAAIRADIGTRLRGLVAAEVEASQALIAA